MDRLPLRVGDHDVRVLRNGREVFPAMLEAIAAARNIVRIEMYWWEPDAVGRRFLDAVVAAARRGVDVRVLVDGFGSNSLPGTFWEPLLRAGGKAATFHPMPSWMGLPMLRTLLARDHRKVVLADDRAFVGGLNLNLLWAPAGEGGSDWRDTVLEVRGTATTVHLTELFASTWAAATGEVRVDAPRPIAWTGDDELAIVSNTPTEPRGRRIRRSYLRALRQSKSTIDITCAYFSPRPVFLRALARAARRGVRVRILVPLRSDVELARQASLPLLRWLAHRGVKVFAYAGGILHAKTAVVDGRWCTVGSHNLDGLSLAWNLECNVVARHTGLAAELTALFEEDLCLAVPWPRSGAGLLERLLPDVLRRWYSNG